MQLLSCCLLISGSGGSQLHVMRLFKQPPWETYLMRNRGLLTNSHGSESSWKQTLLVKLLDDWSPNQHLDCNQMRNPEPEPPSSAASELLIDLITFHYELTFIIARECILLNVCFNALKWVSTCFMYQYVIISFVEDVSFILEKIFSTIWYVISNIIYQYKFIYHVI